MLSKVHYRVYKSAPLVPILTFSLLGPSILLSALFSNTISSSSLSVTDQVSYPCEAAGKISLCVLVFIFFGKE